MKVLKLSAQGLPQSWISLEQAVIHYAAGDVRWESGGEVAVFHGGTNAITGQQSIITVNSIIGTKGVMVLPHVGKPILLPEDKYQGYEMPKLESVNHWHSFVEAVRGNGKTSANFDYAGRLTETVLLGNVALRAGKKIQWDGDKMRITNDEAANQFVTREYRKGFEIA